MIRVGSGSVALKSLNTVTNFGNTNDTRMKIAVLPMRSKNAG
jgi:hypothetical protein